LEGGRFFADDRELQTFCENIKTYRNKSEISKKEMAKRLKIGVHTLNVLESGHIPPRVSVDVFFRFALLCNVPAPAVFKSIPIHTQGQA